ncbi:serine hydrolase domain-containing protein [Actinomadura rudentiformis]|uniref:Beta-lactamase family protein n=1 Tax=Actinomadura rudentiformis TaxID=359158 RepID=A0A6H9Z1X5_9ACTN|nr:serine hydrolase domain-containing protein [Actinomadura rudentiformis]KAB2348266.1 beta-lactamase family protein [Actinomadura rudentiformis]
MSRPVLRRVAVVFAALSVTLPIAPAVQAADPPAARGVVEAQHPNAKVATAAKERPVSAERGGAHRRASTAGKKAAADPTYGDDQLLTSQTNWWTLNGATAAQIQSFMDSNGARPTDIVAEGTNSSGAPTFTVTMVANSGDYRTSSWAWYYGLTMDGVHQRLQEWNARPVSVHRYWTTDGWRFVVAMVDNSGAQARPWWWWAGDLSFIQSKVASTGARITRVREWQSDTGPQYDVLMTPGNVGWWYWIGGSPSQINDLANRNAARLIDVDRNADGSFNAVMVADPGGRTPGWWYGFSHAELTNKALRTGGRLLSAQRYNDSGTYRFVGVINRNVNSADLPGEVVRNTLSQTVAARGSGGVAEFRDSSRGTFTATAGNSPGTNARFRTASISKTFVATELLKQVAAGRVSLNATVAQYLPGAVNGGDKVTIRMLLHHTSGLYNFTNDQGDFASTMTKAWTPQELLAIVNRHDPVFAPGAKYGYSNTNYLLAAMVIEKVTGLSYGEAIRRDIIEPLGLSGTSVPATTVMPAPALRGFWTNPTSGSLIETTGQNPTRWFGAGQLVSTAADENTFFRSLLQGTVLPAAQLSEFKSGLVHTGNGTLYAGKGIFRTTLSCGVNVWWHDGRIPGYRSFSAHTENGSRSMTWAYSERDYNYNPLDDELFNTAFCYI